MLLKDVMFSVNDYDADGDVTDRGIYLHFGETRIKVSDSLKDFRDVADRIASMVDEIAENYPGR